MNDAQQQIDQRCRRRKHGNDSDDTDFDDDVPMGLWGLWPHAVTAAGVGDGGGAGAVCSVFCALLCSL